MATLPFETYRYTVDCLTPKSIGAVDPPAAVIYTDGLTMLRNKLDKLGRTVGDLMKILDEIERERV